jgi:hypothetical protein
MTGLLIYVAGSVNIVWTFAGLWLLAYRKFMPTPPIVRTLWVELRPFYLPTVAVLIATDIARGAIWGWYLVWHIDWVVNWYLFRNADEDDRWKRRGRKVLEKIQATDHGLVVVPQAVTR